MENGAKKHGREMIIFPIRVLGCLLEIGKIFVGFSLERHMYSPNDTALKDKDLHRLRFLNHFLNYTFIYFLPLNKSNFTAKITCTWWSISFLNGCFLNVTWIGILYIFLREMIFDFVQSKWDNFGTTFWQRLMMFKSVINGVLNLVNGYICTRG